MEKNIEKQILDIVNAIPYGMVTTYGEIAKVVGLKSSARMVGWILNAHRDNMEIPFHRVVNRNGELTGKMHFATPTLMRELLISEGITFSEEAVNMAKHLWKPKKEDIFPVRNISEG
jgi:methylated-DNA-protein-cysteine methyltransferase-like protein